MVESGFVWTLDCDWLFAGVVLVVAVVEYVNVAVSFGSGSTRSRREPEFPRHNHNYPYSSYPPTLRLGCWEESRLRGSLPLGGALVVRTTGQFWSWSYGPPAFLSSRCFFTVFPGLQTNKQTNRYHWKWTGMKHWHHVDVPTKQNRCQPAVDLQGERGTEISAELSVKQRWRCSFPSISAGLFFNIWTKFVHKKAEHL